MPNQVDPAKPDSEHTGYMQVRGTSRKIRVWCGRWYKPWTWFRWTTAYVVGGYQFVSWSAVRAPDPNRNGDNFDPGAYNRVVGRSDARERCNNE